MRNLAVIAALLPCAALAQTGSIEGQVADARGPVAGAQVTASGEALQGERSARTDAAGAFFLPQLPPGSYSLNVSAEGREAVTQENVAVAPGSALRLRIPLRREAEGGAAVGSAAQSPVISAPLLETGGAVTREEAALLPYRLETMGFEQPLASLPGVLVQERRAGTWQTFAEATRYRVDGLDVTGSTLAGVRLPQQFVEQVGLRRGVYGAESGRSTSALVDAVTRSGSNQLHGSVFGFLVPAESAPGGRARADFAGQGGVELGGPLQRDRLWFYAGLAPEALKVANSAAAVDYQYVGKLTLRPAPDQSLALSVFGDPQRGRGEPGNVAAQYHGNLSGLLLDASGGVRALSGGGRAEGALSGGAFLQLAGHHLFKAGGDFSHNSADGLEGSLFSAWAQDRWEALDSFFVDAGLRYEGQDALAQRAELLPRLGASWDFTGRGLSRLHAGIGRFFTPARRDFFREAAVETISSAGVELQFYRDAVASADYTHQRGADVVVLSLQKPLSQNYLLGASGAFGSSPLQPGAAVLFRLQAAYVYEWSASTAATLGTALRIANRVSTEVGLDARAALRYALTPSSLLAVNLDLLNALDAQGDPAYGPRGLRLGASVSF